MKTDTASSRVPRRHRTSPQLGPCPESPSPASEQGSNTPPAPETKPPTLSQKFTKRLAAIFAGGVSGPGELFEPLGDFEPREQEMVGSLRDRTAQELFSLAQSLEEEMLQTPRPRNRSQIDSYRHQTLTLTMQRQLAMKLFIEHVKAAFPGSDTPAERGIGICHNWRVVLYRNPDESLKSMMEILGMPEGLLEKLEADIAEQRRRS
jgi:hypothetical protein